MSTIAILNLAQISRRANEYEDPRWIFYQAILESRTFADYMARVGGKFVVPPMHARRMGAAIEYQYMRDNRNWIRDDPDSDDQASDSSESDFRPTPENDARLRVLREIVARQGQARFRLALLELYAGRCAITGCAVKPLLEAAHVTPYLGEYTNNMTNGVLLRADIHSLWDLGLIAAHPDTRSIWVCPTVADVDPVYQALSGHSLREPVDPASRPSSEALKHQWAFATATKQ